MSTPDDLNALRGLSHDELAAHHARAQRMHAPGRSSVAAEGSDLGDQVVAVMQTRRAGGHAEAPQQADENDLGDQEENRELPGDLGDQVVAAMLRARGAR